MLNDLRMFARYARGLNSYLRHTLTPEECRCMLVRQLDAREESFLRILERGIYANPGSPYRKLLLHAGVEFADVVELVRRYGVEGALVKLYDAGVYVTLNEFKGRRSIERPGLQIIVHPKDFDNPFLVKHYEARTGGSRGVGTRIIIDFDLLTHEAAYFHHILAAFGLAETPIGAWHEVPPVAAGMKLLLRYARLGKSVERWFAQSKLSSSPKDLKFAIFTNYTLYTSRILGRQLPVPEYVPLEEASKVAHWLSFKKGNGKPATLDTNPSSAVRVCLAAKENSLDISGSLFRLGGEPYTPAKAQVLADTGCRAVCHYSMSEIGTVGTACTAPPELDDVHLLSDKVAVIQRPKSVGAGGLTVEALVYTTVLPSCPKLMLNVESDDYGVLEDRTCSCPFGELGFTKHLSRIRSYEKLTSDGVTFLGTELLRLVEEVLPARFGGYPTDYQLLEEEDGGLPRVNVIVSPRVGNVNEEEVVALAFQVLHRYPGGEIMSDKWRQGQTLRVLRREPYSTGSAKILPLHILQKR
ncbi:MAG TPA: hypothetical protein VNN20_07485 [Thermodesulfobacteriota bacterium]|nr:hypothetical protein [Thermodesulfobacteriota bacterium]